MDLRRFFENPALNRILPMLLQQQIQRKGYESWGETQADLIRRGLEKTLSEYEAWGGEQSKLATQSLMNDLIRTLMQTGKEGVSGMDLPIQELIKQFTPVSEHYGIDFPGVSPEYPTMLQDRSSIVKALAAAQKTGIMPAEDTITQASQIFGSKFMTDWLDKFEKLTAGRVETGLRGKEYLEKVKSRELAWEELLTRREELAVEKGKPGKKKPSEMLSLLDKREKTLSDQIKELEEEIDIDPDDPRIIQKTNEIKDIRKRKIAILDKMEVDMNMDKINEALEKLRGINATPEALEKHKKAFVEQFSLSEVEYQYIKANL